MAFCTFTLYSQVFFISPLISDLTYVCSSPPSLIIFHLIYQAREVSLCCSLKPGERKEKNLFSFLHEDFMRSAGQCVIVPEKDTGYQNCISKIKTEEMSELSI